MLPISRRAPYKCRSPETWDLIRTACRLGESGPSLARRFDVTTWNIYKKAMEEGWSRRAMILAEAEGRAATYDAAHRRMWPEPEPGPEEMEPLPPPSSLPLEEWTSLKDPPPSSMRDRRWPKPPPWRREPFDGAPPGYGPMPPHLVPPVQRPEGEG